MKKWIIGILAAMAIPAAVWGAQVVASEYIRSYGQYGRSDGVYQRTDTGGLELFINGYRSGSLGKTVYEDFTDYGDGDDWCMQSDGTGCSATDTETNLIGFPSGNKLACNMFIGQTVDGGVDMDAGSLDISGDQTENDGLECAWGTHGASGAPMVVGVDPAFYSCIKIAIANVSGVDDFHFGFRVIHDGDTDYGFNKVYDDYHDLADIGIITQAATAAIQISTIGGDGAASETDTTNTWADGATKTLCVYVSSAGVTTFTINGAAPTTTATYTFTDGESVIPFAHNIQAATAQSGEMDLYEWKYGYGTWPTNK